MIGSPQQLIWEAWNRRPNGPLASREELVQMALRLGASPKQAMDEMVRRRLAIPVFRGQYYVRTPDEILLGQTHFDPVQLFALGADRANLGGWYFALDSALRLHGLSQEFARTEQVVSNRVQKSKPIEIAGRGFEVLRWSAAPQETGSGIVFLPLRNRRVRLRVSDPPRTLIDFLYRDYWAQRKAHDPLGRWADLRGIVDVAAAHRRLALFEDTRFREWAKPRLKA